MPYYPPRYEPEPEKKPRGRAIRWTILLLSAALVIYGGVRLAIYLSELKAVQKTTEEFRAYAAEPPANTEAAPQERKAETTSAPAAPQAEAAPLRAEKLPAVEYPNGYALVPRIQKLREKGKYIIGWITLDELDEPVVYRDNTYFLTHDASGNHNKNGAIFMDEGTSLLTRPYTILLYGHNMKSGAMFGNLRKYEDFSYYFKHRTFQFDTLYEEGKYIIFSVANVCLTPGTSHFVSLSGLQSSEREVRKKALDDLVRIRRYDTLTDVNEEDQILLLITCVGDDDERLIVAARRLREGEKEEQLLSSQMQP